MIPAYRPHTIIFALRFIPLTIGDVVLARDPRDSRVIIKRISQIEHDAFFLVGDNEQESTDSRVFGFVSKKHILAKVIAKL